MLTVIGSEKADYRDCFGILIQCPLTLESGVVEAGFVSEIEPVKHG